MLREELFKERSARSLYYGIHIAPRYLLFMCIARIEDKLPTTPAVLQQIWRRSMVRAPDPRISPETVDLIKEMAVQNRLWGCAGYLGYLFQKSALTMARPFFFSTLYASVGDGKVSCVTCILPDFGTDILSSQHRPISELRPT